MGTLGEQYIGSFWAYDEDGNVYKINIFKSIIDVGHLQDPNATMSGMPRLETENGMSVNVVDINKGEYLIVETNTRVFKKGNS